MPLSSSIKKLLEMDEVRLEFDDDALYAIAKMAKEKEGRSELFVRL